MEQIVRVRRTFPNGTAEVVRVRESACSGDCHKCSGCGAAQQTMLLTVQNPIGAAAGDTVIISSDTGTVLKAAALLYILPVVTFIAGYLVGEHLWAQGPLVAILGFILGMALIKLYDRHLAKKDTVYTIKGYGPKSTEKGDNEID